MNTVRATTVALHPTKICIVGQKIPRKDARLPVMLQRAMAAEAEAAREARAKVMIVVMIIILVIMKVMKVILMIMVVITVGLWQCLW